MSSTLPSSLSPALRSLSLTSTNEQEQPVPKDTLPLKIPSGSGTVPERALKANTPPPRAQRESNPSPEPSCERRHGPAEPHRKHSQPLNRSLSPVPCHLCRTTRDKCSLTERNAYR